MIIQKLQDDLIASLKSHQQNRVDIVRLMIAEIKNARIAKMDDLTGDEEVAVLKKMNKKLKEALEMFEKAGRTDLVEHNRTQLAIVQEYMPTEMTDEDLEKAISALIEHNQETFSAQPKSIIGIAMKSLSLQAEPSRIMAALQKRM
ncbi:hypothetical protein A3I56_00715 [Candidatus Roizmanbacteria bacterium RIFCSPLOWO2_02_FULL_43_10]|uniref:Glutamyl-tRNA amidotransferase n=3 Tax=Candidatus Roizmaniibacteriota TaxID=1752723 RepID=A0A1F7JVV9_9BACT|nr:MAG: hypothetical protein A3D08_02500 [Candidatus Roizmanbacteria bacterium RIFCSPHIGHO2_02_FULL_43_11]OGK37685.1 MAG: hypothetical protein A3F32_02860 [Candidatus Roizmanbacteria bacterium RIFCSPHIGHO2_12_FULL_42_10]OGK59740.1 MAG: hypothetical protein A3I56_00715 [Candidatus Roizmanbacteria bacterium RIFCSPLOWO2_02_FULL_43_10]